MMAAGLFETPFGARMIRKYLNGLVNLFFKILPIRESGEPSLKTYMESLRCEMLGCKSLVEAIDADPQYMSLVSILQFLIENEGCDVSVFKREVFKAISICNKLSARYAPENPEEEG
jgi:hypothetical protein